ncbi:MAG: hypothetical protein ACK4K0_07750 [Flavobacteriales bacterium]
MIYRVFKSNIPLVVLLLFPVLAILSLKEWITPSDHIIEQSSPIYSFFFSTISQSLFLNYATAFLLTITTAIMLNWLININELFDRQTFLPSLIYVITIGSFPKFSQLNPILIANFFLVIAVWRLFQVKRDASASKEMFDSAFFIALAALFYTPFLFFFLLTWVCLIIFRPFVWREWLLALFGFCFPIAVSAALYFVFNQLLDFDFYFNWEGTYKADIFTENVIIRSGASSLILMNFILAAYASFSKFSTNTLRFKRLLTLFAFLGVISILAMLYCRFISNEEVYPIFIALPSALFFTFYYQNSKSFIASVMFYLTLGFSLVNIYFF